MKSFRNKIKRLIGDDIIYIVKDIRNKVRPSAVYLHDLNEDIKRKAFYSQFVHKGDLYFDVGANMGNRVTPLLELGTKIIAFEPQRSCRNILKWKFGNKITLVPQALGEKEDVKELHISNFSGLSSISTEWINSVKDTRFKNFEWSGVEKVQVSTLDKAIEKYGVPKFIKIDVEGYEPEVLKGLSRPIDMISFEYTTPEQTDKLIFCIKRIASINPDVEFNYSVGEGMKFSLDKWIGTDEMLTLVRSRAFILTDFGDVYARTKGGNHK